jgi:RHS repeat-associated protein
VDEAFAFTGRNFDSDTGLQNNLHRWFDPRVGRWLSEDPIGFAAGDANLYRYVGNQPTIYVDPYGFLPAEEGERWPRLKGFGRSLRDSWHSMQNAITAEILTDYYSLEEEANPYWDSASKKGPLGQTEDSDPVFYYGTRGGLGLSTAAKAAIVARGAVAAARGEEMMLSHGSKVRIAPFGNRTGHPTGRYPHYHRAVPHKVTK